MAAAAIILTVAAIADDFFAAVSATSPAEMRSVVTVVRNTQTTGPTVISHILFRF